MPHPDSILAPADPQCTLLRHMIATLAYRAAKVLRDAPPEFATTRIEPSVRTPLEILTHMGDLFDWALSMAQNRTVWNDATPLAWDDEVQRFFTAVTTLDTHLATSAPVPPVIVEKLVQGPVADALTHTGQLAMLRRVTGAPIRGESYARAEIVVGRTGSEQAPARYEFQ
jgi:hypothetical protein